MAAAFATRRSILAIASVAGALAITAAGHASAAGLPSGRTVTLIQPYGPDSPAAAAVERLLPALRRTLGTEIAVEQPAGGPRGAAGGGAIEDVAQTAPDGMTLVAVEPLSREIYEAQHSDALRLESMTPIAKLTLGLSAALFVDQNSPIRNVQDFLAAAKTRTLTVSHGWCVGMALIRAFLGVPLNEQMMMEDRASVVEAVRSGSADAGMFMTISLLPQPDTPPPPVRVLTTFGAKRHPMLPDVPTFAEVTQDPRADFTGSIAVFGPPGIPAETAAALTEAFLEAGRDSTVLNEAKQRNFPLDVQGPEVVRETIARDARNVRRLEGFLKVH